MEKIIFFALVIPIFAFVLYLGGNAIMKGMSAKNANRDSKNLENDEIENFSKVQKNLSEELDKLNNLLKEGRLKIEGGEYRGKKITYHDPCYLGRANNEYNAPRELIKKLELELIEMKRCKSNGLCCGAGGAQMFKDAEKGDKEINIERTEEALDTKTSVIAAGCPFCNTMISDGVKAKEKEKDVKVLDIVELIVTAQDL